MSARRFWLVIAVAAGVLWAVFGGILGGIVGGIILGVMGFVGTLFMAGMLRAASDSKEEKDGDETLEM